MKCQAGHWNLFIDCSARQETCNAKKEACDPQTIVVCNDGHKICRNNAVMECRNNDYTVIQDCGAQKSCNSSTFNCDDQILKVCVDGEAKCVGTTPMLCSDNSWVQQTPCGANESCNPTTGGCDKAACTPGAATCNGNTLQYCDSNAQEQTRVCASGTICSAEQVDCISPNADKCNINNTQVNNGDTLCSNGSLVICNNGNTTIKSCGYSQICRDGAKQCSDYNPCPNGNDEIAHNAQACSANENAVVRCNDGHLDVVTRCTGTNVCMPAGNGFDCQPQPEQSCILNGTTIRNGTSICDGNKLRTCNSGDLDSGTDCAANNNHKSLCSGDTCIAASCKLDADTLASGLTACNAAGSQIVKCIDGDLTELKDSSACTSTQVCQMQGSKPVCVDKGKSYTKITDIWSDFNSIVDEKCSQTANFVKPADINITGVVTHINKSSEYLFVQDTSVSTAQNAGIMINCKNNGCDADLMNTLSVGKKVTVKADGIGYAYCQLQIRANTTNGIVVTQSNNQTVTAVGVDVSNVNTGVPNNLYNSSLVKISNSQVLNAVSGGFQVQDKTGVLTVSTESYNSSLQTGHKYPITGIIKYINNTSMLLPRNATDIVEIQCTGQ